VKEWRELSQLPDAPEYWRGLHERIQRAGRPYIGRPSRRERWLDAALTTAVLATAALIATIVLMPASPPAVTSIEASLAPADPVARALLESRQPPHVSGLLPAYARGAAQ
jgi:hypothetical protein